MNRFFYFLMMTLVVAACLTLILGETPWNTVWTGIQHRWDGTASGWNPLLDERLPRLIVIVCTGASLAVSGVVMQALFHNPLASPSVLGISCGGSLCVVLVFIMEWHLSYPYSIPLAAFGGSLLTLLLVYLLAHYQGNTYVPTLVLTGIAIATLFFAIQETIAFALRDNWQLMQTLTEWKAGSTADRSWEHVHMQLPLTLVGITVCWIYRKEIDLLSLGEEEAKMLGVEVDTVRWRLFLSVALLTGGAIATVGIIAFFGLILPHMMRKILGPSNRLLIPYSVLAGSTALIVMDLALRLLEIRAFSIGNISSIFGGCFFLVLLLNRRNPQTVS